MNIIEILKKNLVLIIIKINNKPKLILINFIIYYLKCVIYIIRINSYLNFYLNYN